MGSSHSTEKKEEHNTTINQTNIVNMPIISCGSGLSQGMQNSYCSALSSIDEFNKLEEGQRSDQEKRRRVREYLSRGLKQDKISMDELAHIFKTLNTYNNLGLNEGMVYEEMAALFEVDVREMNSQIQELRQRIDQPAIQNTNPDQNKEQLKLELQQFINQTIDSKVQTIMQQLQQTQAGQNQCQNQCQNQ
ncbi:Rundc1 [Acrasis kona]|uniref:Rundc1 n=1 Tax=Acrasis kona TaxID=1008807 RepID=A0AAW2Z6C6_9EUKA